MSAGRRAAAAGGWVLVAVALMWGLFRFGATETTSPFRVVLIMVPACLLIGASTPLRGRRMALTSLVGFALATAFLLADPIQGRGLLIALLGWLAFFVVLTRQPHRLRSVVGFLLIVGGLEAGLGLVQALGGVDYIGSYYRGIGARATGTLINHNHFAGMLNMLLALAFGLLLTGYRRRQRAGRRAGEHLSWAWVMLLLTAFMGLAVLLSLSRAGTAVLIITLVVMGVLAALRFGGGSRRLRLQVTGLSLALIGVIALLVLALGTSALADRFSRLAPDWELRATLYADTLNVIAESPWTGVGPGLFAWRLRPHQSLDATTWWRNAHNDYLQSAAEWGIPLAAAFWLFVCYRLLAAVAAFWKHTDEYFQGLALGTSGALLSILLHSLVDFNLQIPTTLMLFGAVLAVSWLCCDTPDAVPAQSPPRTVP